MHLKIR